MVPVKFSLKADCYTNRRYRPKFNSALQSAEVVQCRMPGVQTTPVSFQQMATIPSQLKPGLLQDMGYHLPSSLSVADAQH